MAKFSDYVDESGSPKTPEPAKQEGQEAEQAALPHEVEEAPEPDDGIPEKFKGKELKDVVQMYQEVEKLAGRKGQEAGQLQARLEDLQKTVDALILQGSSPSKDETDDEDYFTDPKKAINKSLENNETIREMKAELAKTRAESQVAALKARHPDAETVVRSQDFLDWVQEESGRRILYEAAGSGNLQAADTVLSDFKKSRKPKTDNRKTETQKAKTGATTGSTAPSSRKIYRRHDVIELMKKDRPRYMSMLKGDLGAAYREGRVRD